MTAEATSRAGRLAVALRASGDLPASPTAHDVAMAIDRRMRSPMAAVPLLRPGYVEPTWFADLNSVYMRAELAAAGLGPPVFATFSGPSQTGKSAFGEVSIARWLVRRPQDFIATLSYGTDLTLPRSRRIRDDAQLLGARLRDDSSAVEHWTTREGGGLLATGLGGPVTGQPGLVLIDIDDPYKDEQEATSAAVKARINSLFSAVIMTRVNERTSVLVKFARWATDDLIGYIQSQKLPGWEHYRVPVLGEDGEPLVRIPGRDRAFYEKKRANMTPANWAALMMGLPRPRSGRLFLAGAPTYTTRPPSFDRIAIGIDFAYSKKTASDNNAAVVVGKAGTKFYVLRVVRRQCSAPEWAAVLADLRAQFPAATMHAYIGGTELGVVDMLREPPYRLNVRATTTRMDKWSRAQKTAGHWNGDAETNVPRRIHVPESASWDLPGFLERLADFSGNDGDSDDEVDALVAAVDACGVINEGGGSRGDDRDRFRSEADRAGSLV